MSKIKPSNDFDLLFSSFVLFDLPSKNDIISYLKQGSSFLKNDGIFILITGSEELYSTNRQWTAFDANFPENQSLSSGNIAKLRLKKPSIEFRDYYWTNSDYIECFHKSHLDVIEVYKPTGKAQDPYLWADEKKVAPFTVYILKKSLDTLPNPV